MKELLEQAKDILTGHINEIIGNNETLAEQRMNICRACPIFLDKWGGICDSTKYISLDGAD